ncbi:hypothetical protein [Terrisporobacter sp.]
MKYTKEEMDVISEKIIEMLNEKEEMRMGKIAKVLIHSGLVKSSYEVDKVLKYKRFICKSKDGYMDTDKK